MNNRRCAALCGRHVKRIERHGGVERVAHRPADDASTEHIADNGEIEKASGRRHISDVGDPALIQRGRATPRRPQTRHKPSTRMSGPNRPVHVGITLRVRRGRQCTPRVKAAFSNTQDTTHRGDRGEGLICRHECEASGGIVPDSRAKPAAALPKMSRSTFNCRCSRRSQRNSSRSPVVNTLGRSPRSASSWKIRWRIVCSDGSNSSPTLCSYDPRGPTR